MNNYNGVATVESVQVFSDPQEIRSFLASINGEITEYKVVATFDGKFVVILSLKAI